MSKQIEYIDTGVPYCPQIPNTWEVKRLKFVGKSIIGITYNPTQVTDKENGNLVLRSSNVQNGILSFEDNVYVNAVISDKHLSKEGDILICARNGSAHLVGKSAYIPKEYEGLTFGAFMLMFRSNYGKFMYYVFNSNLFKSQTGLFATSTINQLTSDTINNLFVALPRSEEERNIIADFLEMKTKEIDLIISKKQKLIDCLKEERMSIINRAVTKGIDPEVEMKESGIDWIREIPKHWEMKKLKYVVGLRDEYLEETDFKIAVENIESYSGKLVKMEEEKNFEGSLSKFSIGDTLFNKLRPYLHKVYYAEKDGGIFGELLVLFSKGELEPKYLYYLLTNKSFIDIVDGSTQGTKMPRAYWEGFISQLFVVYPKDKNEQLKITTFLDGEIEKIENAILKIEQEIVLIKEYRTSLINEVVTGKITLN